MDRHREVLIETVGLTGSPREMMMSRTSEDRIRKVSLEQAVRYLAGRSRYTDEQAREAILDLDYDWNSGGQTLATALGAYVTRTRDGYIVRYSAVRERREEEAVDEHWCPECNAAPGVGCCMIRGHGTPRPKTKHPHAGRVREATRS
jgi:hypothetical protein